MGEFIWERKTTIRWVMKRHLTKASVAGLVVSLAWGVVIAAPGGGGGRGTGGGGHSGGAGHGSGHGGGAHMTGPGHGSSGARPVGSGKSVSTAHRLSTSHRSTASTRKGVRPAGSKVRTVVRPASARVRTTDVTARRAFNPTNKSSTTLINHFSSTGSARDVQLARALTARTVLSTAQIGRLQQIARANAGTAVGRTAWLAWAENRRAWQGWGLASGLRRWYPFGLPVGAAVADGGPLGGMPGVFFAASDAGIDGPGIQVALDADYDPNVAPTGDDDTSEAPWQTARFLRLTNSTKDRLTVYVQVKTENEDEDWVWFPTKPGGDEVLAYELDAGETIQLSDGDWKVNGSRARVWAESAARQYNTFRDQDLWLVPETDDEGYHGYYSADMQTLDIAIR